MLPLLWMNLISCFGFFWGGGSRLRPQAIALIAQSVATPLTEPSITTALLSLFKMLNICINTVLNRCKAIPSAAKSGQYNPKGGRLVLICNFATRCHSIWYNESSSTRLTFVVLDATFCSLIFKFAGCLYPKQITSLSTSIGSLR